jgi:hypothetical protein
LVRCAYPFIDQLQDKIMRAHRLDQLATAEFGLRAPIGGASIEVVE